MVVLASHGWVHDEGLVIRLLYLNHLLGKGQQRQLWPSSMRNRHPLSGW